MTNRFKVGDGRRVLFPRRDDVMLKTNPRGVRRSICRFLVQQFEQKGYSEHSAADGSMWVVMEHCRENGMTPKVERFASGHFKVSKP